MSAVYTKPVDNAQWERIQAGMLGLVENETITQASEVTEQSISDYLVGTVDSRTCDVEKTAYDGGFSFESPHA